MILLLIVLMWHLKAKKTSAAEKTTSVKELLIVTLQSLRKTLMISGVIILVLELILFFTIGSRGIIAGLLLELLVMMGAFVYALLSVDSKLKK